MGAASRAQDIPWSPAAQERARARQEKKQSYRPEHEAALVEAARGHRLEACWLTMLWTGLRPGEVTGLTWSCVDLEAGLLQVTRARRHTSDGMVLGPPKGGEEGPLKRTITLTGPVVTSLKAHKARQAEEKLRHRDIWPETDLVFTTRLGTMIDRRSLERSFSALAERAGLGSDWHPHETRHLYTSQLVEDGLSITEVADALGHARGSRTTAEVYAHKMRDVAGATASAAIEQRHGRSS